MVGRKEEHHYRSGARPALNLKSSSDSFGALRKSHEPEMRVVVGTDDLICVEPDTIVANEQAQRVAVVYFELDGNPVRV